MGKYLVLWQLDPSRLPVDPKERGTGWGVLMEMVKKDLEKGTSNSAFFHIIVTWRYLSNYAHITLNRSY